MFFCNKKVRRFAKYSMGTICFVFFILLTIGSRPISNEGTTLPDSGFRNIDYRLSMNLLRLFNTKDSANSIVSPLGIVNNLSVLYAGSSGKTQQQTAAILGASSSPVEMLDRQRKCMNHLVKAGERTGITFEYANTIFADETVCKFKNNFKNIIRNSQICQLEEIKYNDPGNAAAQINEWCRKKTHDRINTIIDPKEIKSQSSFGMTKEPFVSLLSAIYFKGDWSVKFDEDANDEFLFYPEAGAPGQKITMMQQYASLLLYGESENIQMLKMYFKGHDFSLVLVLPKEIMSAKQLVAKITPEEIEKTGNSLLRQSVHVAMPEFDIMNTIDLKPVMKGLGLTDMEDFASMFEPTLTANTVRIEKMKQENQFAVDKKGAKAASVTVTNNFSIGCSAASSNMPMPTVNFIMDRPFLYFLQYESNHSGTVLFAGCYAKPQK